MIFNSPVFIFVFLPVTLLIFFIIGRRNKLLLLASLIFYFLSEPGSGFIFLLATAVVNYFLALNLRDSRQRSLWFFAAILGNAFALFYFKYSRLVPGDFFTTASYAPLGISFFTFQLISYHTDIYLGKHEPEKNFFRFSLYLIFFAHLVAGPIVRYIEIRDELPDLNGSIDWARVASGMGRFIRGLAKKILVADSLRPATDALFALSTHDLSTPLAWLAPALFTVQIYFDFSGYTDMAIGIARIFGFSFRENFNEPFLASGMRGFWQRWHMSLSFWFRDYVFLPLAMSWRHAGKVGMAVALMVTFVISGIWHGAALSFVLWGFYHGCLVLIEIGLEPWFKKIPLILRRAYVFWVVVIGFVFFRQTNISAAIVHLTRLFTASNIHSSADWDALRIDPFIIFVAVCGAISLFVPWKKLFPFNERNLTVTSSILHLFLFILCLAQVVNVTHQAFIYYRF